MKNKQIIYVFIISFLLLIGCKKEGDEFIGYWKTPKIKLASIEIENNNSGFLVIRNFHSPVSGKIETSKIPAQLNNGVLTIVVGIETIRIFVDNSSGKLLYKGLEFEKISKNEFDELVKKAQEKNKSIDDEEAKPKPSSQNSSW